MAKKTLATLIGIVGAISIAAAASAETQSAAKESTVLKVVDQVRPTVRAQVGGILGERLERWRRERLWRVFNDPFLLDGFLDPPGTHPWQGEHVGKWLHAACLAAEATNDPKLEAALKSVAAKLVASQAENGYLGTYAPEERYYARVATGDPKTWDVWTQRYAIYGLLGYCNTHDDPAALDSCKRATDLLLKAVGPPEGDVTRFGTRSGLSAAVLLESIVMMYQRTGDTRYLEFAKHIVRNIEGNPQLRIMAAMRAGEDVTASGDGKAYQLMAVLLGYVELYRCTGDKEYLDTAIKAWERIAKDHINVAGGPWSYQVKNTTNQECFADAKYFHPTNCIETCSTTTWIQLCLSLFDLTGQARFANAAEVSVLNQLLGAQSPDGKDWAYHSMLNMADRGYDNAITCCASSGPRALEMYARHLVGVGDGQLVVNSYVPSVVSLNGENGFRGRVVVEGNYPFTPSAKVRLEVDAPKTFEVALRLPADTAGWKLTINGEPHQADISQLGFLRVKREWKKGDQIGLEFDFRLTANFQTGSDGVRWVAFNWGPLALAQSVITQTDYPVSVLAIEEESVDGFRLLDPEPGAVNSVASNDAVEELDTNSTAESKTRSGMPAWRLKTPRKVVLEPYFQAGSTGGGVRTMFPTRKPF